MLFGRTLNDAKVFVAARNVSNEVNPPPAVVLHHQLTLRYHLPRQHRTSLLEIDEIDLYPDEQLKPTSHLVQLRRIGSSSEQCSQVPVRIWPFESSRARSNHSQRVKPPAALEPLDNLRDWPWELHSQQTARALASVGIVSPRPTSQSTAPAPTREFEPQRMEAPQRHVLGGRTGSATSGPPGWVLRAVIGTAEGPAVGPPYSRAPGDAADDRPKPRLSSGIIPATARFHAWRTDIADGGNEANSVASEYPVLLATQTAIVTEISERIAIA